MNQITDSLSLGPPQGDPARPGARPRQPAATAAEQAADTAGVPAEAPAQPPAEPERKPPAAGRAFADVMLADPTAAAASPAPPPARAAAMAPPGRTALPGAGLATQTPIPATGAAAARQPMPSAGQPVLPRSAGGRDPSPAPADPAAAPPTAGSAPADRLLPVAVQRARPELAGIAAPVTRRIDLPAGITVPGHASVKAAAQDFAEQMTRGAARLTPAAPVQDIAMARPLPPTMAAATAADAAAPGATDTSPDPSLDVQPGTLSGDRQALLITPARAVPAAAAPLLHHQPPMPPGHAPESILAQISTHLSGNGRSEMTLQLDPPELGLVRIGLTMGEGHVTAVITADRPDIDGMLRRHAAQLTAALEQAGYRGVDLSFGDGGQNRGGMADGGAPTPSAFVRLAAVDPAQTPPGDSQMTPGDSLDLRL